MLLGTQALPQPLGLQSIDRRRGNRRNMARAQGVVSALPEYCDTAEGLTRAARVANLSAGRCAPHPKSGCVLVNKEGRFISEAFQPGQAGMRAEVSAVVEAAGGAMGGTAFLNLEPVCGPAGGDKRAVEALADSGVSKVVIGLLHPIAQLRGEGVAALRAAGLQARRPSPHGPFIPLPPLQPSAPPPKPSPTPEGPSPQLQVEVAAESSAEADACRRVNEALLHRAATGLPFSIWKYAMTLDGKIATTSGHAAWVSGPLARAMVHDERARSDAVIVGGQTLRRDNPNLTTRKADGHIPARIVLTQSMDLPEEAILWDVGVAPTIVMTRRGARPELQARLRARGVEVVAFEELTPAAVVQHCAARGYLQCLWECGGTLAAAAVADGVLHKVQAFVATKLVGGQGAPTPLGGAGFATMDAALALTDVELSAVGPDVLFTGFLPPSGGPRAAEAVAAAKAAAAASSSPQRGPRQPDSRGVGFYKAWDEYGYLSNFSPHPIAVDGETWLTVEHYYQSQKFAGVADADARRFYAAIRAAPTPEAAARVGRGAQRTHPGSLRGDWGEAKLRVMRAALTAKFTQHACAGAALRALCAAGAIPVEESPTDGIWGVGADGSGGNLLGVMLAEVAASLAVTPSAVNGIAVLHEEAAAGSAAK